jgi:hypothetical protein
MRTEKEQCCLVDQKMSKALKMLHSACGSRNEVGRFACSREILEILGEPSLELVEFE